MTDHLAYRKKFGTLGPSTNTVVQPDFDDLRPAGVTNHYSRIAIPNDPVNVTSGSHSHSPRRDTSSVRMGRTLGGSSQGACSGGSLAGR